jgi:hypothetical protein
MPIEIACPGCGKQLKAPDAAAGKRVKCPQCATVVPVPAPPPPIVPQAPPPMSGVSDLIDEAIQEELVKRRKAEEDEFHFQEQQALRSVREGAKQSALEMAAKPLTNPDDDLTVFDWMFAFFLACPALIMAIVYMVQGKKKGLKLLIAVIAIQVVETIVAVIVFVVLLLTGSLPTS